MSPQRRGAASIEAPDADVVAAYLRGLPRHEPWSGGRPLLAECPSPQAMRLVNRIAEMSTWSPCKLPRPSRRTTTELSDRLAAALAQQSGLVDPKIARLTARLPERAGTAGSVEAVLHAVRAHLRAKYGVASPSDAPGGRLSDRQLRAAKAMLSADGRGELHLADVARACGLSRAYFIKAFKASTGVTPHRWQLRQRTEMAKRLLRDTSLPIVDIAIACGFADQSHLTRTFAAAAGVTPAAFRRARRK